MINNIQFLRAFAAINVVLFHAIGAAPSYSHEAVLFHFFEGWGANGVDVFFVISGFIMLYSLTLKKKSPLEFVVGRCIRIVPIYWIVTMLIVIVFYLSPSIFRELIITPEWTIASLFFTSLLIFEKTPIVYVGWTLELEVIFYLIISISILMKSFNVAFLFIGLLLTIVSLYADNYIMIEFFFGCIIAYIYHRYKLSANLGVFIFFFGVATLGISLLPQIKHLDLHRIFIWGIPSFFLVFGAVFSPQIKNFALSYLGDASYSIYLIQIMTIPAIYKLVNLFKLQVNGDALVFFCVLMSVVIGCIFHSSVEKPISNLFGKMKYS